MIQKSNSTLDRTYLTKPKEEFKALIKERIEIGEKLCGRKISDFQEYVNLDEDKNKWHTFNLELLRISFNKEQNRFFGEYNWSPRYTWGVATPTTPTTEELISECKSEVYKYLTRLKIILEKIPLMEEANAVSDNDSISKKSHSNIDLKRKVAEGKQLSVINELLGNPKYHNDSKKFNELILLLQQITRVNKEKELGMIKFDEEDRTLNRITKALLKILDE